MNMISEPEYKLKYKICIERIKECEIPDITPESILLYGYK